MKKGNTMVLNGRVYENVRAMQERGIVLGDTTLIKYVKSGRLPKPVIIGAQRYFDREQVDACLLGE